MPRQGGESSLNKAKLLIAGLTLLVVSGFMLVGACCGIVLKQLEEVKTKMLDMEVMIRHNTDTILGKKIPQSQSKYHQIPS